MFFSHLLLDLQVNSRQLFHVERPGVALSGQLFNLMTSLWRCPRSRSLSPPPLQRAPPGPVRLCTEVCSEVSHLSHFTLVPYWMVLCYLRVIRQVHF